MSGEVRASAELVLSPTNEGGLSGALPSGTRSLLLKFSGFDENPDQICVGAVISTLSAQDLEPGTCKIDVELIFWSDEARIHATPGTRFAIWYGRIVGEGVIVDLVANLT